MNHVSSALGLFIHSSNQNKNYYKSYTIFFFVHVCVYIHVIKWETGCGLCCYANIIKSNREKNWIIKRKVYYNYPLDTQNIETHTHTHPRTSHIYVIRFLSYDEEKSRYRSMTLFCFTPGNFFIYTHTRANKEKYLWHKIFQIFSLYSHILRPSSCYKNALRWHKCTISNIFFFYLYYNSLLSFVFFCICRIRR